jgi:hypothetical protein
MGIFEILDLSRCQNRKSHFWGQKKSAFTQKIIFGDKKGQRSPKTDARTTFCTPRPRATSPARVYPAQPPARNRFTRTLVAPLPAAPCGLVTHGRADHPQFAK